MLFNSLSYLLFFPAVCLIYFSLPQRFRNMFLFAASCFFYMSFIPEYLAILLLILTANYGIALAMERLPRLKKLLLIASLTGTLGVLGVFKYFNFFQRNLAALADTFGGHYPLVLWEMMLPLAISFYTFHILSYVIDVYRGEIKAERSLLTVYLFILFFPQLLAGPITRARDLIPQFSETHAFDYENVTAGLRRIAWGMFKKIVVADRLGGFVSAVFDGPTVLNGLPLVLATVFFTIQIYCDFSGYSDIAIGSARILGFRIAENFKYPLFATSISDYWRRWHMSLSTWFRDYLYFPLGGNRYSQSRWIFNIMAVFLISGLWHGANWTFVLWGGINGFYIVCSRLTQPFRQVFSSALHLDRWPTAVHLWQVLATFGLVSLSRVFYRASSLSDALYICRNSLRGWNWPEIAIPVGAPANFWTYFLLGEFQNYKIHWYVSTLLVLVVVGLVEAAEQRMNLGAWWAKQRSLVRWSVYYGTVAVLIFLGVHKANEFIYYQF